MADYAPYGGRGNGVDYMPNARVPYDPQSRVVRGAPLGFNEQHQYNQNLVNQGLAPGSNAASQAALRAPSAPAHMLANDPVMQQGARFAAKVNTPLTPHEYNQGRLIAQQLHGGFKPRGLASQPVGDIGRAPLAQPPAVPGGAASSPLLGRAAPAPGHPGMPIPGVGIGPEAPADDGSPLKRVGAPQNTPMDRNDVRTWDKGLIQWRQQHGMPATINPRQTAQTPPGTRQSLSGALVANRPRPGTMMQAPPMGGRDRFGIPAGATQPPPGGGLWSAYTPENQAFAGGLRQQAQAAKDPSIRDAMMARADIASMWGPGRLAQFDQEQRLASAHSAQAEKMAAATLGQQLAGGMAQNGMPIQDAIDAGKAYDTAFPLSLIRGVPGLGGGQALGGRGPLMLGGTSKPPTPQQAVKDLQRAGLGETVGLDEKGAPQSSLREMLTAAMTNPALANPMSKEGRALASVMSQPDYQGEVDELQHADNPNSFVPTGNIFERMREAAPALGMAQSDPYGVKYRAGLDPIQRGINSLMRGYWFSTPEQALQKDQDAFRLYQAMTQAGGQKYDKLPANAVRF